jgi:hypothetical protein
MTATKAATRATLTLDAPREAYGEDREPDGLSSELTVRTSAMVGEPSVSLMCSVVWRQDAIERGEPVQAVFHVPDYEKEDPTTDTQRLVVTLDSAEALCEAMLSVVREAKRLGIAGPDRPTD